MFSVAAAFTVVFLASAVKNTLQVFFVSMADSFGRSRGQFALAASLFMFTYGAASPVVGYLADRFGAKRTIVWGVAIAGVGFLASAVTPWFPAFVLLYGVVAAVTYSAMSYVPIGVLVDEAFPRRQQGLLYAIMTNGTAMGFIVLSPLWVFLEQYVSWRPVYFVLGIVFLVPLLAFARSALPSADPSTRPAPDHDGETARESLGVGTREEARHGDTPEGDDDLVVAPRAGERAKLLVVVRSREFRVLAASFFGCGVSMAFIDVHMVAHLTDVRLGRGPIALSVAVLGLTELGGALLAGHLCDRLSKYWVLAGSYLIRSMALLVLATFPSVAGAFLFSAIFGLSYMGTVIATSLYGLELFPQGVKGFAIGVMWFVHQLGAFIATQVGAWVHDLHGDYHPAILGTMAVTLWSGVLVLTFLRPGQRLRPTERDRLAVAAD